MANHPLFLLHFYQHLDQCMIQVHQLENEGLWYDCITFHGHSCPGLAIGFRVVELAAHTLDFRLEKVLDEELVCIAENDSCAVDAIQSLLSCTVGKGNLILRPYGKQAYTFFNRKNGDGVRIVVRPFERVADREVMISQILSSTLEDLMEIKTPLEALPGEARMFDSVLCDSCGEQCREDKIRLQEGRRLCLTCHRPYDRG